MPKIKALRPNKRNPRKISSEREKSLDKSMNKFGDLGCIVFNKRTGNLVGGHQRTKRFSPEESVHYEHKFDAPSRTGTVAEGYVELNGERFKYREVDWTEEMEVEAMLAANNQGGENDAALLRLTLADFPSLDLELAGLPELKPLQPLPPVTTVVSDPVESDEEYVRNTPQTTEEIPTPDSSLNTVNAFDQVQETSEVAGKRYVLIIDCRDDAHRAALKDLIKAQVESSGGRFF